MCTCDTYPTPIVDSNDTQCYDTILPHRDHKSALFESYWRLAAIMALMPRSYICIVSQPPCCCFTPRALELRYRGITLVMNKAFGDM